MDFIQSDLFKLIILGVFCLINLVLILFKKKPASSLMEEMYSVVLNMLPTFINMVEEPGNGSQKKIRVIEAGLAYYERLLHRELTDSERVFYSSRLSTNIENILSTPTKKEEVKK